MRIEDGNPDLEGDLKKGTFCFQKKFILVIMRIEKLVIATARAGNVGVISWQIVGIMALLSSPLFCSAFLEKEKNKNSMQAVTY